MKYILIICCLITGCAKQRAQQVETVTTSNVRTEPEDQGDIIILKRFKDVPYQEVCKELGAPADKTGYNIANAPTKGWNHEELFSLYPKTDKNKNIQIMEITWDSGESMIHACFHMVDGTNRCLVAKRIKKGIMF